MKAKVFYSCLMVCFSPWIQAAEDHPEPLLDMDLAALMQVTLKGSITLTPTANRRLPASVTTITRSMIADSGARNLFDLFDIYVPNYQYLPHHWEAPHMGMRGIIGDREDKFLLVVNGRVLNEKTHFGAFSERDLPMLGDIRKIDVVRGPGSVIYGPGAVSMVINIHTDTFADHAPDVMIYKMGGVENFKSLELRKAIPFSAGGRHGLWLYAGISDYDGASNSDAGLVYGHSTSTTWGERITAGESATFATPNNHAAHRDQPKLKMHAHYQNEDFNAWLRYTRGGEKLTWEHKIIAAPPDGFGVDGTPIEDLAVNSVGYEQMALDLSRLWTLSPTLWLELKGGYDTTIYERILWDSYRPGKTPENHREEEYLLRSTLNWNPSVRHALAVGAEYIHARWGLGSGRQDKPVSFTLGDMESWQTGSIGLFGEHQWQISDTVSQFLGLRADKDDYTDWMLSPRWAVVSALSKSDTVKGIWTRSIRKNNAEELRGQHEAGQDTETEKVTGIELIYTRALADQADVSFSAFRNKAEYVGIDFNTLHSVPVANFSYGGFELELGYRAHDWNLLFSHAFTKLDRFQVAPGASTRIAGTHLGYGNDLNNWSNHCTKMSGTWNFAEGWKFIGDMRIFWGYQGAEDQIDQVTDARAANPNSTSTGNLADPGYKKSVKSATFIDLGLKYQISKKNSVDLYGYNLLGLVDEKYNKRMYLLNASNYRSEAAAVAVNYIYQF